MEREKQPYIPPMSGTEAFAMFGDRRLLTLEEQHKRLSDRLNDFSAQLAHMHEDPDVDLKEMELVESDLQATREMMREHDRLIRKVAQEFGNKRGPVTLH